LLAAAYLVILIGYHGHPRVPTLAARHAHVIVSLCLTGPSPLANSRAKHAKGSHKLSRRRLVYHVSGKPDDKVRRIDITRTLERAKDAYFVSR
jgi:hypothetical protein